MTDSLDTRPTAPVPAQRAGIVAVVGRANVGKSSLVNAILGEKISIVSPVAQTTRSLVRGILTEPRGQLVLIDTPGVHKAESDLGRLMNRSARSAAEGVDVVLLVLDGSVPPAMEDEGWMKRLGQSGAPVVAVLNKKDRGDAHAEAYKAGLPRETWMNLSALTGDGVPELTQHLFSMLPEGPQLFPEDVLTDYPRKLAVADVVREKLFLGLRDELPHAVAVWIERIDDVDGGWQVDGIVYVNKSSQKGIVIGQKGRLLRKVKRAAEAELASIYEKPVSLTLWVKVEPNWNRNFWLLKKFGYVAA
ncbi:MAG TPA: GTPase Era [Kiritimatiellia bacterium]|jgi:GTP-binding protein Era